MGERMEETGGGAGPTLKKEIGFAQWRVTSSRCALRKSSEHKFGDIPVVLVYARFVFVIVLDCRRAFSMTMALPGGIEVETYADIVHRVGFRGQRSHTHPNRASA